MKKKLKSISDVSASTLYSDSQCRIEQGLLMHWSMLCQADVSQTRIWHSIELSWFLISISEVCFSSLLFTQLWYPWGIKHDTASCLQQFSCSIFLKNKYLTCLWSLLTLVSCVIVVILHCIAQLVLWSQPCLRSNCLDQPVHGNEAGCKLPAPLVSSRSAVPCDIHLMSLVWPVNPGWRETLPLLITSAQWAAFTSMNGHGELCLCHHHQTLHLNCISHPHWELPAPEFWFCCSYLNVHILYLSGWVSFDRFTA